MRFLFVEFACVLVFGLMSPVFAQDDFCNTIKTIERSAQEEHSMRSISGKVVSQSDDRTYTSYRALVLLPGVASNNSCEVGIHTLTREVSNEIYKDLGRRITHEGTYECAWEFEGMSSEALIKDHNGMSAAIAKCLGKKLPAAESKKPGLLFAGKAKIKTATGCWRIYSDHFSHRGPVGVMKVIVSNLDDCN